MGTVVSEERLRELIDSVGGLDAILESKRQFEANPKHLEAEKGRNGGC